MHLVGRRCQTRPQCLWPEWLLPEHDTCILASTAAGAAAKGNIQVRVEEPQSYQGPFPVCSSVSLIQYLLPSFLLVEHFRKAWISFKSINIPLGLNKEMKMLCRPYTKRYS